jgi:hypothetical protein
MHASDTPAREEILTPHVLNTIVGSVPYSLRGVYECHELNACPSVGGEVLLKSQKS